MTHTQKTFNSEAMHEETSANASNLPPMNLLIEANRRARDLLPQKPQKRRHYFSLFVLIVLFAFAFAEMGKQTGLREIRYEAFEPQRTPGYFLEHGITWLSIPAEQYPSPGECRIWFFDLPLNVQSPPGNCKELVSRMPAGAWLMQRSNHRADYLQMTVYDPKKPGENAVAIGVFDIDTGALIREFR